MHCVVYPYDPDCPLCKGSGFLYESIPYGQCFCQRYENIKKVQSRCQHEFVCKKCGKEQSIPTVKMTDLKPLPYTC